MKVLLAFAVVLAVLGFNPVLAQDTPATPDNTSVMYGGPAGQYVRVSPDLEIHYLEVGTGTPLIMIPGWTATNKFYLKNIPHFAEHYRVIAYDPRSQGNSSKTPENNNYKQHGEDLKALMDTLNLKDVILMGHSAGCTDAYSYFRLYGTENVKAFVCIDASPSAVVNAEDDWAWIRAVADIQNELNFVFPNRKQSMRDFTKGMLVNPASEDEITWWVEQNLKTPNSVALQLYVDIVVLSDYREEAKMIADKIAVLNVVAEVPEAPGSADVAVNWFKNYAPNTKVVVMKGTKHLVLWEFADEFNAVVDEFLANAE
jgi:non-heme chloroperoxidase